MLNADTIVPVVMFVLIFSVPLVGILTKHQRAMAELAAQTARQDPMELQRMREEIAFLRDKVNEQTLALDNVRALAMGSGQERLGQASTPIVETNQQTNTQF